MEKSRQFRIPLTVPLNRLILEEEKRHLYQLKNIPARLTFLRPEHLTAEAEPVLKVKAV
jgi:hypothetical protein